MDRHRPFFRGFKRGQIQRLKQSCIAGENAALAVQPPVRGIQALDCVGGVDHCSYVVGELEYWVDNPYSIKKYVRVRHGVPH